MFTRAYALLVQANALLAQVNTNLLKQYIVACTFIAKMCISNCINKLMHEKTNNLGFRPGLKKKNGLYSHTRRLDA